MYLTNKLTFYLPVQNETGNWKESKKETYYQTINIETTWNVEGNGLWHKKKEIVVNRAGVVNGEAEKGERTQVIKSFRCQAEKMVLIQEGGILWVSWGRVLLGHTLT